MKHQYFTAYAIRRNEIERTLIDTAPEKVSLYLSKAFKETDYILFITPDNQPFLLCYYGMVSYCAEQSYLTELCQAFRARR